MVGRALEDVQVFILVEGLKIEGFLLFFIVLCFVLLHYQVACATTQKILRIMYNKSIIYNMMACIISIIIIWWPTEFFF